MPTSLNYKDRLEICRCFEWDKEKNRYVGLRDTDTGRKHSSYSLAKKYGVSHSTIQRIVKEYKPEQEKLDTENPKLHLESPVHLEVLKKMTVEFFKAKIKMPMSKEHVDLIKEIAADPEVQKQLKESRNK